MKFSTRILATVLLLVMAFPMFIFSASAAEVITKPADAINPPAREAGMLAIYTPEHGATTGTNQWGYEIIIEDNVATKVNTMGNSAIPANGFVVSGHDENPNGEGKNMATWIKNNIKVGDYVYYSPNGVISVSSEPVEGGQFYSIELKISGKNESRGENMVIVYTSEFGATTATNEWGYEVTVTGGVVSLLGGYNSKIPSAKNSFVVSGHGEKNVAWLQENVKLGMSAVYDEKAKTVTFSYDDSAALSGMEMRLSALQDLYKAALKRYDNFDYKAAEKALSALEKTYKNTKNDYSSDKLSASDLVAVSDKFEEDANKAELLISESRTVEYRGVWIRPTETSVSAVEKKVQELYDLGINMICIETVYDCTTIMPMPEDSLFECNPKFKHFDMLEAYINECHKRDMELHLWLPIFYVGDSRSSNVSKSVGTKKPEWLSISNTGKPSAELSDADNLMMLNPANEEATEYLLKTYRYILENYEVDGLQLDYIRFYTRTAYADGGYDMGYNPDIIAAFEKKFGITPEFNPGAGYWASWVQFRCDYVTAFVEKMRKLIDDVSPDVLLGADVAPDPAEAKNYNYQDYYTWLKNGWIDILFPMSYGYGYEDAIKEQQEKCGDDAYLAVGLGIFMSELNASDMQTQAVYNNSVSADGSVYFESSTYIKKGTGEYLAQGVYRNKAITPSLDIVAAAKAQVEFAKQRINNVILPLEGVSEDGAKSVIEALDKLSASFTEDGYDEDLYGQMNLILNKSGMMSAASARIKSDLKLAIKGYAIKAKNANVSGDVNIPDDTIGEKPSVDTSEPDDTSDNSNTVSDNSNTSADIESGAPVASDDSSKSDEEGSNTVLIVCIAVVVIAAIAGVAVVIVIKKKRG